MGEIRKENYSTGKERGVVIMRKRNDVPATIDPCKQILIRSTVHIFRFVF